MAIICHAFSRIVPRYEFDRNAGLMAVEDLEHTLGRKQTVGYPPRRIFPFRSLRPTGWPESRGRYPRRAVGCGYCSRMEGCVDSSRPYPHCYCC